MSTGKRMDTLVEILTILSELDYVDAKAIVYILDRMKTDNTLFEACQYKSGNADVRGAAAVALAGKRK